MAIPASKADTSSSPIPDAGQSKPLPDIPSHDPFARHSAPIASEDLARLSPEAVEHLKALLGQVANSCLRDAAAFKDCLFALISPLEEVYTQDVLDRLAETRARVQAASDTLAKTPTQSSAGNKVENSSPKSLAKEADADEHDGEKSREGSNGSSEHSPYTKVLFNLKKHPANASEPRRTKYEANSFEGSALFEEDKTEIGEWRKEGGTIHVFAPNSELTQIDDIIRLLVFAVTHLVLEANLRRDSGLERELPKPTIPEPEVFEKASQQTDAPAVPGKENISPSPSLRERRNRPWTSSLWHSLVGNKHSSMPAEPKQVELKQDSPPSSGSRLLNARERIKSQILAPRFRSNSSGGQFDSQRRMHMDIASQDWEVIAPQRKSEDLVTSPDQVDSKPGQLEGKDEVKGEEVFQERFDQVISRIQETKLSLSPSVRFPPPSLLVRLRDQEAKLRQDLEAAVPLSAKSASTKASRITVDSRAGLSSLLRNNNSLQGVCNHQAIQYLYERSSLFAKPTDPACVSSKWTFVSYYDFNDHDLSIYPFENAYDVRLGAAIGQLVTYAEHACHACSRPCKDHITTLAHASSRISIRLRPSTSSELAICNLQQDQIITYSVCQSCKEVTQPRILSTAGAAFSLAKYTECMIYDQDFQPGQKVLCHHVGEDPLLVLRRFLYQNHTVELHVDHIDVYDITLPRAVENSIELTPTSPTRANSTATDKLKLEIKYFYASLQARIERLSLLSNDESQATSEAEAPDVAVREEKGATPPASTLLSDLGNSAKLDESLLLNQLDQLHDDLFRCRNAFVKKATISKDKLESVARQAEARSAEKKDMSAALPDLVQPTYLVNPTAHPLPGSDVILLEDQLGTHLAYALSCQPLRDALRGENYIDSIAACLGSGSPPSSTGLSGLPPRSVSSPVSFSGSGFLNFTGPRAPSLQKSPTEDESGVSVSATRFQADKSSIGFLTLPGLRQQKSADSLSVSDLQSGATTPIGSRPPSIYSESGSSDNSEEDDELDGIIRSKELPVPPTRRTTSSSTKLPALIARATVNREREPKTSNEVTVIGATGHINAMVEADGQSDATRHLKTSSELSQASTVSTLSTNSGKTIVPSSDADVEDTEDLQTPPASTYGTISSIASRGSQLLSPINLFFGLGSKGPTAAPVRTEDEPHVRVKIAIKNVESEIVVWFAEDFEDLRRRCSIPPHEFIDSLSHCEDFDAKGGKSSASFLNTLDQKYVLKMLPYKRFGSSDLAAFQSVAKDYFDHFKKEKRRPSVLGKIYGLFSIRGPNKRNLDVLVLERLAVNANKRFDLKGISTREAKEDGCSSNETFFDANWTTNFRRQSLIPLHAKATLKEALLNDLEYLQQANIMDYSLLLGIDDINQRLSCGIIDALSVYDLAKYFESKGKLMMKSGQHKKDVTVLHPAEYAARFAASIDSSLLAVPEKFSRVDRSDDETRGPRLFFCL